MSFKEFSSAHKSQGKVRPGDKSGETPATDRPATSDKTPAEVAPASKS